MAFEAAVFDLYSLLVEGLFGSIFLSYLGLAIVFIIIGFMTRMSPMLIIFILGMFTTVFGIGYAGAAVAVPMFLGAFIYFGYNLIQFGRRFI